MPVHAAKTSNKLRTSGLIDWLIKRILKTPPELAACSVFAKKNVEETQEHAQGNGKILFSAFAPVPVLATRRGRLRTLIFMRPYMS